MGVLFIIVLLVLPCGSFAQTMSSVDYEREKAVAMQYYNDKEFDKAYESLMILLRENPTDNDINLGVARAAYMARRYNQAIMGYERCIDNTPSNPVFYVELAQVYMALNHYDHAKDYLQKAKEVAPADFKSVNIENLIKYVDKRRQTTFFSGTVGVGYGYDSNANNGPESVNVVLGGLPLTIDEFSLPQASSAIHATAMLNYTQKFHADSNFAFIADLGLYGKYFTNNSVRRNNFLWGRLGAGLRGTFNRFSFSVVAKGDFAQYQSESNVGTFGGEVRLNFVHSKYFSSSTFLGVDGKFYKTSKENEGQYYTVSETVRWAIVPGSSLALTLKYAFRQAQVERLTNDTMDATLRYNQRLPFDIYLNPSVGYKYDFYHGPATALETGYRQDSQYRVGLSLLYYILPVLSVDAAYNFTKNDSSSPIYDYIQHTVTVSCNWYF